MVSEYHELKEQCDRQLFERLLGSEQVKCIDNEILLSAYDDIYSYNHNKRWKIKKEIGKFRRYSELTVQYKKRKSYVEQRIYGVGKTMGEKNKRFAVCGPDGSGKTTLVIRIQKELGKHVLLDVVYMGGSPMSRKLPRKILRATIFPVYTILRRTLDLITLNNTAAVLRDRYYALEDRLITQEKIERYSGSLTKYQSGHFVLYERFPIFEKYGDGGEDESKIRLEQTVTLPDRVFVLMVEESDALLRKSDHDAIDLAKKIAAFRQFKASHKDNPQLSFIGPGLNEDAVFNQVMAEIFAELCSDN